MRKKKHRGSETVELNMAAMLDMAFQLLTFFILTFKPAPVESQIRLRMPLPAPMQGGTASAGANENNKDLVKDFSTLPIYLFSDESAKGHLSGIFIGKDHEEVVVD